MKLLAITIYPEVSQKNGNLGQSRLSWFHYWHLFLRCWCLSGYCRHIKFIYLFINQTHCRKGSIVEYRLVSNMNKAYSQDRQCCFGTSMSLISLADQGLCSTVLNTFSPILPKIDPLIRNCPFELCTVPSKWFREFVCIDMCHTKVTHFKLGWKYSCLKMGIRFTCGKGNFKNESTFYLCTLVRLKLLHNNGSSSAVLNAALFRRLRWFFWSALISNTHSARIAMRYSQTWMMIWLWHDIVYYL